MNFLLRPFDAITNPARPVSRTTFLVLAIVACVLDQLTKIAAVKWLEPIGYVTLIPNFLDLHYATNTGAAWSLFSEHPRALAAFSLVIIVGVIMMGWWIGPEERGLRLGLGLILGGAFGNMIDRVRLAYVIDFIDAHWYTRHWPTFNIADAAICIGISLWLIATIRFAPKPKPAAPK